MKHPHALQGHSLQTRRFSKNGAADVVCNADMRVAEAQQYRPKIMMG